MTPFKFVDRLRDEIAELKAEGSALRTDAEELERNTAVPETERNARLDAMVARAAGIRAEIDAKQERVEELLVLEAERNAAAQIGAGASPTHWRQSPAWQGDPIALPDGDAISHARRALDAIHSRGTVPEQGLTKVSDVLANGLRGEPSRIARWALAASNPHYEGAFAKLLADPVRGHLEWTREEQAAYNAVVTVQRAMSLTDANGGFMVPFTLDPAIMLTNDGSNNPIRRLATVKLTTTDTWNGITSAGATAEWKTEATEVADGSPTLAQPSIPTFFGDSFVPYSFEYGQDAKDALNELTGVLRDAADNLMATAYTTGNGTSAPQGIVTGLAGTASEINTTGSETHDDSDPFVLQNALPARFSANASWMSHIATANAYRQMETTNGALQFPELRGTPPYLLGKPWFENSNMDGSINAAATASNYALIYGDVAKGYFIVDRIGATLELIPNLMGANGRPTGQRGALLWFRTGGEVVVPQALRLLDIPTTA